MIILCVFLVQLVPVAYGVKKLVANCVIEDEKVIIFKINTWSQKTGKDFQKFFRFCGLRFKFVYKGINYLFSKKNS